MKKIAIALFCLASLTYATDYNPVKGEMLSLSCASCHGTNGNSVGITPVIAGMEKITLYNKLLDYKYGRTVGTIMQKHAKGFSDEELKEVATYFSQIKR